MKGLSYILTSTLIILCCVVLSLAQEKILSNKWQDLKLNASTPEDCIRLFGAPTKDKDKTTLEDLRAEIWLSGKQKQKIFRILTFKDLKSYEQVKLAFLDNKLIVIILDVPNAEIESNWLDPDDLESLFSINFKPWYRKIGRKLPLASEFKANSPTELKKEEYNYRYDMIAVTTDSFIVAEVDNNKYIDGGLFDRNKDTKQKRQEINAAGKYPGYVRSIQIIGRSLAL